MRLLRLSIHNFRCLEEFELDPEGLSVFLIGENGTGKSTVLEAVARVLGRGRAVVREDFGDTNRPMTVEVRIDDLTVEQQGLFPDEMDFSEPISLTLGVRAVWDADAESVDVVHGFPKRDWRKLTREQRESLPVEWMPQSREADVMLRFGVRRNLMSRLLEGLPIDESLEKAADGIAAARTQLSEDGALAGLLSDVRTELARLAPVRADHTLSIGTSEATRDELLKNLELFLSHHGDPVAVGRQSSGLGQLAGFAFMMRLVETQPGTILLIDEPEISLHPQAQRALMRAISGLGCQSLLATHSSNLLDRADPRRVVRVFRTDSGVTTARPRDLTDSEAARFARYSTPATAEAFFAQGVILVEGISDKLALEAVAEKNGRNLDAEGITIVCLEGGGGLGTFLGMLGPAGFGLKLAGVCDADQEGDWASRLEAAGVIANPSREAMEAVGFFVCDPDLEDELLRAVGEAAVERMLEDRGDGDSFRLFAQQPSYREESLRKQLRAFIARRGRKVAYAPALVEALKPEDLPPCLVGALEHA